MTPDGGSVRRQYKRPPITEAVAEFRLAPSGEWDPTIPGRFLLQEGIAHVYTGKPRTQRLRQFLILGAAPGPVPGVATHDSPDRVQLPDQTGSAMVTLGPNTLSVNALRPYEGWHRYQPRIRTAVTAFEAVAEPMRIVRVGLRYINQIGIPIAGGGKVDLEEYFRCAPPIIEGIPRDHRDFNFNCEYVYEDGCTLRLNHGLTVAEQTDRNVLNLVLDLDLGWMSGESPISSDTAMSMVELLHQREGMAFESIITDKTRELFDAD